MAAAPLPNGFPPYGRTGGGTARTAGWLGILIVVFGMIVTLHEVYTISTHWAGIDDLVRVCGLVAAAVILDLLLLVAGVLLLRRQAAGRIMLVILAAIDIVWVLMTDFLDLLFAVALVPVLGLIVLSLALEVVVIILCLVPPTGRWLAAGRHTPPMPVYHPPPGQV
jgi:hypothetical protein